MGQGWMRIDVDGGAFIPQVKGNCLPIADLDERLGQDMLPRMLLHMVQSAFPVNPPFNMIRLTRLIKDMDNAMVFSFNNVNHRNLV